MNDSHRENGKEKKEKVPKENKKVFKVEMSKSSITDKVDIRYQRGALNTDATTNQGIVEDQRSSHIRRITRNMRDSLEQNKRRTDGKQLYFTKATTASTSKQAENTRTNGQCIFTMVKKKPLQSFMEMTKTQKIQDEKFHGETATVGSEQVTKEECNTTY